MKTRLILAMTMALLTSAAVLADTKDVPRLTETGKILEKSIAYPQSARLSKVEGNVSFALKVNEDQTVEYQVLASDNDMLSEYVGRRIQKMESRLAKTLQEGEEQIFRMKFEIKE
jgi:hypothetical protein